MNAPSPRGSADLHVHTTHSDGACSPCEVVQAAANLGLKALAITDHDTVSALAVAHADSHRLGVELIPGVELTAEIDGREVHILGYFIRDDGEMRDVCQTMRQARVSRIESMVSRLQDEGLSIDLDALRGLFPRATIGRRHLADWLLKTGQVADRRLVFERYLGDAGLAAVPKPRLGFAGAISLIRRSGGVAALAHPPYDLREATLARFVEYGMRALEVLGPGVPKRREARLRAWSEKFGLVPVAGSDFHANDRPGRWLGSITTPADVLDRLRAASLPVGSAGRESEEGMACPPRLES